MEIVILPDSGAVARFGSAVLADVVHRDPEAVLGLATGSSPLGIYAELAEPLHMDPVRVHVPDGRAADLPGACSAYEEAIRAAGGIDVQILGIGANGHIGFNEPTSSFASRTRIKTLAPRTRSDNARFFEHEDEVPTHCLTQGLGTILEAERILL